VYTIGVSLDVSGPFQRPETGRLSVCAPVMGMEGGGGYRRLTVRSAAEPIGNRVIKRKKEREWYGYSIRWVDGLHFMKRCN